MIQVFRIAFRRLSRAPMFALSVCAALGLTSAALMVACVVAYAVLLSPLPYSEPAELVFVQQQSLRTGNLGPFSAADYLDVRAQSTTLASAAAAEAWSPVWTGDGAAAERLTGLRVSGDLFATLGVPAEYGRTIEPDDDRVDAQRVAVISHRLWQRLLGGQPALGRSLRLNGETFTVLGVMPRGFEFPTFWQTGVDVWVPFRWTPEQTAGRNGSSLRVFGRQAAIIDQDFGAIF